MGDHNGGVSIPEHRLLAAIPVAFLLPASTFMCGWSAQDRLHWLVPDIGIMLFGFAFNTPFLTLNIHLVDAYRRYSANAFAAASFLRSVFGPHSRRLRCTPHKSFCTWFPVFMQGSQYC
ncbi:hypothetical protein DFJ73DRAFT_667385 [Zopfochytrium polystomum]|nr:hypothetical protein DFJ73DRAFT_667385 [Zopfochytrium polystomum]